MSDTLPRRVPYDGLFNDGRFSNPNDFGFPHEDSTGTASKEPSEDVKLLPQYTSIRLGGVSPRDTALTRIQLNTLYALLTQLQAQHTDPSDSVLITQTQLLVESDLLAMGIEIIHLNDDLTRGG